VTLYVELLMPDRELWSGEAGLVIAKTLDGDIGVQTGHSPVFGILAEGSLVRIQDVPGQETSGDAVRAAVSGGFLSVTDNRVSILAARAQLATEVDTSTVRQDLDAAIAEAGSAAAAEESPDARYARAQLRAAGEQA
jgi:F-type H+-transporting ATPase subunit epsilon